MRPISRINKGISINELLSAPIQCEAPLSPQICFQRFVGMKWKSQDFEPNLRSCARCCIIIFPCLSKVMIIFHDTLLSANTVCDCEAMLNNLQLHLCFHLNINTVFFTITYRSALWLLSLFWPGTSRKVTQKSTVSHFTFVLFSQPFKWDGSQGGCSAPWTATLNTSSLNTVGQTSCETARTLIPTRTLTLNMKNIKDFLSL